MSYKNTIRSSKLFNLFVVCSLNLEIHSFNFGSSLCHLFFQTIWVTLVMEYSPLSAWHTKVNFLAPFAWPTGVHIKHVFITTPWQPGARLSKVPKKFRTRKAVAKFQTLRLQGWFIHMFLMLTEVLFVRFRLINFSQFRYRLTKTGSARPKMFQSFRETSLRPLNCSVSWVEGWYQLDCSFFFNTTVTSQC